MHLYYGDDKARGNQKWQAEGCSGEVRGSKGYLILHKGGDTNIARAIRSGRQMSLFPFPADLIELHEAELVQPGPVQLHAVEDHGQASVRLEGVYPGARNESLFLVVRLWAYKQRRGSDLESWCQWVEYFTLESNLRLPVPLPEREASLLPIRFLRGSGASWTKPARQRARGRWIIQASLKHGVGHGAASLGDVRHR